MPKVETYGQNRVSTQQVQNQRVSPPPMAKNTSIAPGLNALASGIAQYQEKADETAAEDALIKFEREKNELFFNPDSGYFNTQGRTAYDGAKGTNEALAEMQQRYADSLSSPRAREAFKRSSNVHLTRAMTDIDRHAASGLSSYEQATREARIENTLESASLYWNNTQEAAIQNAVGRDAIIDNAEAQGLSAEATNEMLQTYESNFSKARIEAAMANDLETANDMFAKFGDRIEGRDRLVVEDALKKANFDAKAVQVSDTIINSGSGSLAEMMSQVDQLPSATPDDIAMRKEVTRLVNNRYTMQKKMEKDLQEQVYEDYGKQIQDGAVTSNDIPANAWNAMTVSQRRNIHKIEREMAKGTPRVTDERLLQDILSLPASELAKRDPLDYYDKLSNSDYDKVQNAINKAKNGKQSDPDYVEVVSNATRLKNTMRTIFGGDVNNLKGDNLERYNAISRAIQIQVETAQQANGGKELTPSQKDELYNSFARKVTIERNNWFDGEAELTDYDASDIDLATQYLRELGVPINSVNLINFIRDNPDRFGD